MDQFILLFILLNIFFLVLSAKKPPSIPPEDLVSGYSVEGKIPIEYFYVDDTMGGNGTHYKYVKSEIDAYVKGAYALMKKFDQFNARVRSNPPFDMESDTKNALFAAQSIRYLPKQQWVQYSLYMMRDLIENRNVAVYGSMEPWLESFLIALNASVVYTIEYNNLTYEHPILTTVAGHQFEAFYHEESTYHHFFDIIITPSAFDHDGLGRYGDPLNADGDLQAMRQVQRILKHDGLLFLTVPIGPDVAVFNLHRRYGSVRLPMLFKGWEIIHRFGWDEASLTTPANWRQTYEPVFVLKSTTIHEINEMKSAIDGDKNLLTENVDHPEL